MLFVFAMRAAVCEGTRRRTGWPQNFVMGVTPTKNVLWVAGARLPMRAAHLLNQCRRLPQNDLRKLRSNFDLSWICRRVLRSVFQVWVFENWKIGALRCVFTQGTYSHTRLQIASLLWRFSCVCEGFTLRICKAFLLLLCRNYMKCIQNVTSYVAFIRL